MKPLINSVCVAFAFSFACASTKAAPWEPPSGEKQLPLWSGVIPHSRKLPGPENSTTDKDELIAGKTCTMVTNVSRPTITVYSPKGKNTGTAVVVFPGGGYKILAMDLEGTEICDWLTSQGITAVLLKYRVPSEKLHPARGSLETLEDSQRAIRLVRFNSGKWHIDPHKIGVIGFSAGGHLVAATSTRFKERLYPPVDAADKESCRPDFAMAIYPGHLWIDREKFELNPDIRVTRETPPTFLLQNEDDKVDPPEHSLVYYRALKKAQVPVEMHFYANGGHAFGLRPTKLPVSKWPRLAESWLATIGMIPEPHQ